MRFDKEQKSAVDALLLIGGVWEKGTGPEAPIIDKYHLTSVGTAFTASSEQLERILDVADSTFRSEEVKAYQRGEILARAARLLKERQSDFIRAMQAEAGFTESDASREVGRCIETLKLSGEEARRLAGEMIPIEGAPGQDGRIAFTFRVPLGVVAAVTPFNSPLNTVAHKVAPAFAAGNTVILKPSTRTPLTACLFAQCLLDAGMPPGFLSVLHGEAEITSQLLRDERVKFIAFTGSTEVGRSIQSIAGLRRTQMELGSIAFTILCDDADLDSALPKVVSAGYRKAGQVCTSVQMLMVHTSIKAEVEHRLSGMVGALKFGDPRAAETVVGPMISEAEALRVERWIDEAITKGASRLVGGSRQGGVLPPTLLSDIAENMQVSRCEIFGPVVCILSFETLSEAIARVNATPFGLAAGIFTARLDNAFAAARQLEVGGVHINETSSSRVDMMPYGGSKNSGFGREGPHYAIREMTEERVVTISAS